jgi:hypothetical protein
MNAASTATTPMAYPGGGSVRNSQLHVKIAAETFTSRKILCDGFEATHKEWSRPGMVEIVALSET